MSRNVSESVIASRLSRFLKRTEGVLLRKCRETSRDYANLGLWYAIDIETGGVAIPNVDVEREARDAGLLKTGEVLAMAD